MRRPSGESEQSEADGKHSQQRWKLFCRTQGQDAAEQHGSADRNISRPREAELGLRGVSPSGHPEKRQATKDVGHQSCGRGKGQGSDHIAENGKTER